MSILIDKAGFTAHIYKCLMNHAALAEEETDGMKLLQLLSGVMVETLLLFDDPDEGLSATYGRLADMLECEPMAGKIARRALPPSFMLDMNTEMGRALARRLFEDWLNCAFEFHEMILFVVHNVICRMAEDGAGKAELFRLFIEISNRCMAYEIAAQELCDIVIDEKIGRHGWSLGDSVAGLSAVAGRNLALSIDTDHRFHNPHLPEMLDQVSYVMTQEAVRLGIPAGTDWRLGLAANDYPPKAPHELIAALHPVCTEFFRVICLNDLVDQAVACAKAAGRMLAVAAGGEEPEIEPVIAKPLAMAAMTETYRTICLLSAASQQM